MGLKALRSGSARRLISTIGKPSSMARFGVRPVAAEFSTWGIEWLLIAIKTLRWSGDVLIAGRRRDAGATPVRAQSTASAFPSATTRRAYKVCWPHRPADASARARESWLRARQWAPASPPGRDAAQPAPPARET